MAAPAASQSTVKRNMTPPHMDSPSPIPDADRYKNRLPTLNEVLQRRTMAPVDLFSYYIYMRDQQRSVDYLDFWLDVTQHMSLCRHYVRELRRSVLVETPELEKGSKRSSMILDQFADPNDPAGPSNQKEDSKTRDQHLSAYLRQERQNGYGNADDSPHSSLGSEQSGARGSGDRAPNGERLPRASFMSNGLHNTTDSNSPAHTVARQDLRVSAENILYTYLLSGSEREIILPQGMLNDIITSIEEDGRDDPEVFDAAKDYTFQAMERDAFPGFLRSKALGNLVPPSKFLRMILGLAGMFGGFWAGFALIFLDKPKHIRCWVSAQKSSS
ncbi:Bud site selection protein, Revert to axial protein 1 [Lambiella insularis]|nr:Bud site selection protein, Revert to axial protein 1 [Lambiella insularis]